MDWISDWAGGIIVAVIIGTIIEMILPEGNSKKYIKVVIGVYVLFTIVSPIITKFTGKNIEVSDILELDKYIEEAEESVKVQNTIQNNNQSSIMNMYASGIKDDMKAKIKAKGYIVNSIDIGVADDESYIIQYISLEVEKNEDSKNTNEETENNSKENNIGNIVEPIESIEKVDININNETSNTIKEDNENDDSKKNKLSYSEKKDLKEYLSSVYELSEDDITIN